MANMSEISKINPNDAQSNMPADPFAPKKVYVKTPAGLALDVVSTAEQYSNPSIPQLAASSLRVGDRLTVGIEAQSPLEYAVEGTVIDSMAFGSDDIISPGVNMMIAGGERAGDRVQLIGSSISPRGTLLTPGSIKVGTYLNTYSQGATEVSGGVITDFSVSRRDKEGEYAEVPLNKQESSPQESESFAAIVKDYADIVSILASKGFRFEDQGQGFPAIYRRVNNQTFVYAGNQGFGNAVIPQHEAYMYNAAEHLLIGMRYLPTEKKAQMAVMQNVAPEMFAEETFAHDETRVLDWRKAISLEPSVMHRMSNRTPFVTYTWLSGSTEKPTITVKASTEAEGVLGIEGSAGYAISITQGEEPTVSAEQPGWWVKYPENYKAHELWGTKLQDQGEEYRLTYFDKPLQLAKDPQAYMHTLVEAFRQS